MKKEYEHADFLIKEKMEKIEVLLMEKLGQLDLESMKTPSGTVYTQLETRYTCGDWTTYWDWMLQTGRVDCVEKRVSQGAMRQLEEDGEELPPAINVSRERVIRVRRSP